MKTTVSSIPFFHLLQRHRLTTKAQTTLLIVMLILSGITFGRRVFAAREPSVAANHSASDQLPNLRGQEAIDQLKQQGLYSSLQEAMSAARYEAQWVNNTGVAGMEGAYELKNAANNFRAYVDQNELRVLPLSGESEKPWRLGLKLVGMGYGEKLSSIAAGEVKATGKRVEIARQSSFGNRKSAIVEWFINSSRGIEHGFDIAARPAGQKAGEALQLRLEVSGDLLANVNGSGAGAYFSRESANALLSYDKLFVTDAKGQALAASMRLDGGELVIEIADDYAEYPLTIDPLLRELQKVTASDGAASDLFGASVAISGDTAVVGAYLDDVVGNAEQGSAYVFVRSGTNWTQQQKLTASDGLAGDNFGTSVAVSGDTVVVGAYLDNVGANADQGSTYVFVRSGTVWLQQQKLTASDGAPSDDFGISVAIFGDTVVVGAPFDNVGANADQGSAYVFVRSGTVWSQKQLVASDGAANDGFGYSVAISGETVLVGAPGANVGANPDQGSAYAFVRSGTAWSQQQKLVASDGAASDSFGVPVDISGETVVVGAFFDTVGANAQQGSAYVFVRGGTVWSQQQKLLASDGASGDEFGFSVAITGDTVVVGAPFDQGAGANQGSAYVFVRSGTAWSQQQKLVASDGAAGDEFGLSVAIGGDTVVVGALGDDIGANLDQGSAYFFVCNWDQQAKLLASDGAASDFFGNSIAISGNTVVVGAGRDDVGGNTDQGSAYVFTRSGTIWTEQQRLSAIGGAADDQFGQSVAISGDTVVVGAYFDDVGVNTNQGSAYVFIRSGPTWTQQAQLTATDGVTFADFGSSVAISGDTVVVGAVFDTVGPNSAQGSAYVFTRGGATWTQQQKLTASDGAANDFLGCSVAISGDTIVVGSFFDDVGANADQGSSYVFARSGAAWTEQQKLTAGDGGANDKFGISVAISGDTVVVGAHFHDVGPNTDQGSAYVFIRSGVTWMQQQELMASDGAANDIFGVSVAISGDTVVVGAYGDDVGTNADQGSAYIFTRNGTIWVHRQQFAASDGGAVEAFGRSIAISGDSIVVGAAEDDVGANSNQGSAYIFFNGCNTAPVIVANGSVARQQGSPAAPATIANVEDSQDPIGYLSVSVASAPADISISNITNTNGVITATVSASCYAALGDNIVILQVQDSDGAVSTVQLLVNVTANTLPTLGSYADTSIAVTSSTTVTPSLAPFDNGSIVQFSATSPNFAGTLGASRSSGNITIANARPPGAHIVTVTAIDNCGDTISTGFVLTVICQAITVNPTTIAAGTAGTSYSQPFDSTGGSGAVTLSLSGTLPTGLSFNTASAKLIGTPTQVGDFPITVTATDVNGCSGSRNYTLTINAPLLVWTGNTSPDWHTATNWSPNAAPASFHDVLIPTAGVVNQPTISTSSSVIHAMTVQTGRILTINASRQLITQGDIVSSGQITGAGLLAFDGMTFAQNGAVSVAAVQFDAGSHSLTGGGAFASGIVTVLGGATVTLTSNHSVSVLVINSGGTVDATNRTLTLTGAGTAIFNSGLFTATGSTIIYQGTISQVVTPNINYNNLTINNAAGVFLSADTTVNGLLNLTTDLTTGSAILTMPASGTSTGPGDVIGNVKRTGFATGGAALSFGNALNTIQINTGTAPSDITINLMKLPPFGFSNCVSRTYSITANGGSGISATMRLRYKDIESSGLDESSFELWRYDGPNWLSPAGIATRNTTQNWVEEVGIAQFSQWTIAGGSGPSCGVLSPNSQFFSIVGGEGSVIVTALPGCIWMAGSSASWLEITSSAGGAGSDIVSYVVRDNFAPVPRQATLTIAGQPFTVVQDSETAPDCVFSISAAFASFNASGGTGSIDVITEERCAWQAVSSESWITITSNCCGIANGTVSYTVAANPGTTGRNGTITIAGHTFAVKQKRN